MTSITRERQVTVPFEPNKEGVKKSKKNSHTYAEIP